MRFLPKLPSIPSALIATLALLVAGTACAQFTDAPPVPLTDHGDHVTLANGIVSFAIAKANGNIDGFKYNLMSILAEPGYLEWVGDGNHHIANYRQWGLWLKFPTDFPNGVNFVIGQSREATDWNSI